MDLLFIHEAFPAQFGHVAVELSRRYGWKCRFLVEDLSRCPTPTKAMLETLDIQRLPVSAEYRANRDLPWPQMYGRYLELCQATYAAVRARPEWKPDLVVAHGGCGAPTLFLPEVLKCPIVNYCEYYFALGRCDISYRIDLPPAEPAQFYPRCINAIVLASLVDCTSGYSPTEWQRQSFPERFRPKIEVHFDGIDTELYRPRVVPRVIAGNAVPADTRIVTYVARGLESMRGFDQFMKVAQRIATERSQVLFVVVGSELTYYGWDKLHTGQPSFKQWVLSQGSYDLSRFVFIDHLFPEQLAELLCLSDLHLYLTVPFVLSWSMLDALASGCLVLASDVPPVREMIDNGRNGLVAPFFDIDSLAETALRVLDDPAAHRPLGAAAREEMQAKYSLDVAIPQLKAYFERVAN
jgi:glycosyltransferase involved in cell wall biosynthesis